MIVNKRSGRIDPTVKYKDLLVHIPHGAENAVSMRNLSVILDKDPRQVRALIVRARIDGLVIAGTNVGYFIPMTTAELREYVNRTDHRVKTTCMSIAPAKRLLKKVDSDE